MNEKKKVEMGEVTYSEGRTKLFLKYGPIAYIISKAIGEEPPALLDFIIKMGDNLPKVKAAIEIGLLEEVAEDVFEAKAEAEGGAVEIDPLELVMAQIIGRATQAGRGMEALDGCDCPICVKRRGK